MKSTYIQYGIPSDWADEFQQKNISVTTFKNTSKKNLVDKYGIEKDKIDFVKSALTRRPVDEDTLQLLLERNRFVCCLCKGQKSDAYIIHHIEPYSISQNNEYFNLAVLCPNDHDLVHREGDNLTSKITSKQIEKAKLNWEKEVEVLNVKAASKEKRKLKLAVFSEEGRFFRSVKDIMEGYLLKEEISISSIKLTDITHINDVKSICVKIFYPKRNHASIEEAITEARKTA